MDNDREGLAAEYVLGTLDAGERAEVERKIGQDPDLRHAIAAWQRRLEPMIDMVAPIEAPPHILEEIFKRIGRTSAPPHRGRILRLERSARFWRRTALAAGALAACLIVFAVSREFSRPAETNFVAVLESNERVPAFVASVDLKRGRISIIRVGSEPAQGRSHELWALGAGRKAPQSLGVINASARIPAERLGSLETSKLHDTVFAISLEPIGGSPTGQPTGPVVFTGKLVPLVEQ